MQPHTFDTNPGGSETELSISAAFDLVSNDRRRLVAAVLADRVEPVTLDELATEIADREATPSARDGDDLRVALHHCHLPKLADAGLVQYDRETKRLTPLPALSGFIDAFDFEDASIATRSAN